jgi:carbamoyltransferase
LLPTVKVLGVNAVFHDPAAAVVVDGRVVAAAEEERFTRRKHGKVPVPFSTWELPEYSAAWCLERAGLEAGDLDAVAYSYDPRLAAPLNGDVTADAWEGLRTLFVERAPLFLRSALGVDPERVEFVPHHVAHAASACLAAGWEEASVMVIDGRGERTSYLAGRYRDGYLEVLRTQALPHSLGLLYEELTAHLGFRRSSDEYKVMALASHGTADHLDDFRRIVRVEDGGYRVLPVDWSRYAPALAGGDGEGWDQRHAGLAATVQRRLEEVLVELASWLHGRTGDERLGLAGGVALNCVANSRLWREGPFSEIWVQPAAGDAGTALGAALHVARAGGDTIEPMATAALGREWSEPDLAGWLDRAAIPYERPDDIADAAAQVIAEDGVVAWFQGRSEYGPRALGHRSLLANPTRAENLERLNDIKGREQFRPVAPMVLADRAGEIFDGPLPSPFMLFTHRVRDGWHERIPAVIHVDGTARIQTVDREQEPLVARMLEAFERRTGVPVVVNTSLNTAGRPMVDDPRDALECFGSAPVDALVLGPFLVKRGSLAA